MNSYTEKVLEEVKTKNQSGIQLILTKRIHGNNTAIEQVKNIINKHKKIAVI